MRRTHHGTGARHFGAASRMLMIVVGIALAACGGSTGAGGGDAGTEVTPTNSEPQEETSPEAQPSSVYEDGQTVRIVVPFSAGGGFDIQARLLAPYLEAELEAATDVDLNVIVENVTGGGGLVGVQTAYRAEPDGRTVVFFELDNIVGSQVAEGADVDVGTMTPIGLLFEDPRGLLIRTGVLDDADADFAALLDRSQEEPVLWGATGQYGSSLLIGLLQQAGYDFQVERVDFPGTSDAVASMLRGELEVYMGTAKRMVPSVEANPDDLRILTVFSAKRDPELPDVPTLAEQGIENADLINDAAGSTKRVLFAPPGLDEATASVLQDAVRAAFSTEGFQQDLADAGYVPGYLGPDELQAMVQATLRVYTENADLLEDSGG